MSVERDGGTGGRLLRAWPVMLGVFLVTFAALTWYVVSQPVEYSSRSVVAFQPRPDQAQGRDLTALLVQTYPEYVASSEAVALAAEESGLPAADIAAGLDAEIPPLTLMMTISTRMADPAQAQAATQALTAQVVERGKSDPFLTASAVSTADYDEAPAGLPRSVLIAVSLLLAAGLAVVSGALVVGIRSDRTQD